jgi:hypothetical protein
MADHGKVCPECGHVFQGNGWDGIDAHWRSKHEGTMPYEEAWPKIKDGSYQHSENFIGSDAIIVAMNEITIVISIQDLMAVRHALQSERNKYKDSLDPLIAKNSQPYIDALSHLERYLVNLPEAKSAQNGLM